MLSSPHERKWRGSQLPLHPIPNCFACLPRAGVLSYAVVDKTRLSGEIDLDAHDVFFVSLAHGFTSAAAFQVRE